MKNESLNLKDIVCKNPMWMIKQRDSHQHVIDQNESTTSSAPWGMDEGWMVGG